MKKKILLFILIIILVYSIGGIIYIYMNKKPSAEPVKISNLDTIKGYNYALRSNDTALYKEVFNNLKKNLESKEINDEEYAKTLTKLFIIDLYTLNNKINKYDVGGAQFVHPDYVSNYKLNVQNTLYKYMEDNSYKNRTQELPEVASVNITNAEKTNYKIGDNSFEGYKITLEWTYVKDLEYDSKGEVTLVKIDNLYYVVQKD